MNFIDFELNLSNDSIYYSNILIKRFTIFSIINFSMIILLICFAIYYQSFNWMNGFVAGINFILFCYNINYRQNLRKEIEIEKLKIDLYESIKNMNQ
jgi:hypothetical protein